jgi:hypothetical protein
LEIDSKLSQIAREPGAISVMVFSYNGVCVKSYGITDEAKITLYSNISLMINRCGKRAVKEFLSAELDVLRVHSTELEMIFTFEEDFIIFALYKQSD